MAMYARIFQDNPIRLWGLSSRERLERMLKKAGIATESEDCQPDPDKDSMLLLRGDFLYDQRIILSMIDAVGVVLEVSTTQGPRPVAAHVSAALAERMEVILCANDPCDYPTGLRIESTESLASPYLRALRKSEAPYLLPITASNRRRLEKRLFDGSYKGVTDLVTKWLWPLPARWVTRFCAHYGIVPNQVTALSLLLSILAGVQFYQGYYAGGLLSAWLMTFLDTVDGKLARVTINYSPFGNIFDHGIDLIFPPIWYFAWGMSFHQLQAEVAGISMSLVVWLILGGYAAGRLAEGIFIRALESSGIFCWQPIDSCFRLITGRRNPNLIILTISLYFGRPDIGLLAVALWTVASSIFLFVRLVMGVQARIKSGPLRSWFLDVDPANEQLSIFQRWFCRRPDAPSSQHD